MLLLVRGVLEGSSWVLEVSGEVVDSREGMMAARLFSPLRGGF